MDPLDPIRAQIKRGEYKNAKRALAFFVEQHPDSVPAWTLLAGLVTDPEQQMDCYRRILALDPSNVQATTALQRLTERSHQPGATQRCPQCGGKLVVRFIGEMKDKRATCWHCGAEIDLPDAYQRVERQHEQERHSTHTRTVDRTVIETRSDYPRDSNVDRIIRRTQQLGAEERVARRIEPEGGPARLWPALLDWFQGQRGTVTGNHTTSQQDENDLLLSPEEMIEAAGGPLPPEERRKCPECGTTLPKQARHCGWCGTRFSGS